MMEKALSLQKKLIGYRVIFYNREDKPINLSVDDGKRLENELIKIKPPRFIRLSQKGMTVRTTTIDYLLEDYEVLEEWCMMCRKAKLKRKPCPNGCDEK